MQHDLFANPNRRGRPGFPFVVDLQADAVESAYWIVAPLTPATDRVPITRILPIVRHGDQRYAVLCTLITNISSRLLRHPVGPIAQCRDDLTRALDWLFFGI